MSEPTGKGGRPAGPRRDAAPEGVFSSTLSGAEQRLLEEAGYVPRGVVSGSAVMHVIPPPMRPFESAEIYGLSGVLMAARDSVIGRMAKAGRELAATGVVGVRLHVDDFHHEPSLVHLVAVGTAVAPSSGTVAGERRPPFFTTNLGGQDFSLLRRSGYLPVNLVIGCSVCRVGRQSPFPWLTSRVSSQEMGTATTVLYAAREAAMARLQDCARRDDADGVVGVSITERQHVWGSHVIEFLVTGTSMVRVDPDAPPLRPELVMGMA
jgi:uncharacterized protein YbjQ (UPF0145 family)